MVTSCSARRARFSVALALAFGLTAELLLLLLLCVCARHLAWSHQRRLLISSLAFSVTRAAVNCSQLPRSWRLSLFDV